MWAVEYGWGLRAIVFISAHHTRNTEIELFAIFKVLIDMVLSEIIKKI